MKKTHWKFELSAKLVEVQVGDSQTEQSTQEKVLFAHHENATFSEESWRCSELLRYFADAFSFCSTKIQLVTPRLKPAELLGWPDSESPMPAQEDQRPPADRQQTASTLQP